MRFKRLRWAAPAFYSVSVPTLAILAYRFWDRYVGPDAFSIWRLEISPTGLPFLLPLALVSPLLLWAMQKGESERKGDNASAALACFALAGVLAAVMSDHLFLLVGLSALTTWCAAGAAVLRGKMAGRLLPFLFPLAAADLCLALGALFFYLSDPSRGLFFPAASLAPSGMLAASCALMLAAALLRLGGFPLHRWMAGASRGGEDLRLVHLLAVDLTLGVFMLFAVSRLFFVWDGPWVWVCLGAAAATMVEVTRELLHASDREEAWGLLCAACGAALAMVAAPGGQAAAAAARVGLWAGIPALALVELGSEGGSGMGWVRVAGGASLLGLPPLAGFAWLWMGFAALAGGFTGGMTVVFLAAVPLLFAGALVSGTAALLLPRGGEERTAPGVAAVTALFLAAFCAAVGLYPGAMVDLLMREYGLPLDIPFASWTALGWAVLICTGLAVIVASAWIQRRGEARAGRAHAAGPLPLLDKRWPLPHSLLERRRLRGAAVLGELFIYAGWIAVMVYLGVK